jgi:hypothetical protein
MIYSNNFDEIIMPKFFGELSEKEKLKDKNEIFKKKLIECNKGNVSIVIFEHPSELSIKLRESIRLRFTLINKIRNEILFLNETYGSGRDIFKDNGGYVAIVKTLKDIETYLGIESIIEDMEGFELNKAFLEIIYLLNDEAAISFFIIIKTKEEYEHYCYLLANNKKEIK